MGLNLNVSFICDKKAEHYITSHWSQLPDDMIYALCASNYRQSFTKNQVKEDLQRMLNEMI